MTHDIKHIFIILFSISIIAYGQNNFEISFDNHKHSEEREISISIYEQGITLYKIDKVLQPGFSIPKVAVFENGNSVLIHSLEGVVEFYSNGVLQIQKILINNNFYNESSILFSVDKNQIAFLVTNEEKNKIILFEDSGNRIFEKNIQGGLGSGIAYSEHNDILAVSINKWEGNQLKSNSIFSNIKTNVEFTLPYNFEKGSFEMNSSSFLGQSNYEMFFVDLTTRNIVWNKRTDSNSIIVDSKIKNNSVWVVEAKKPKLINNSWIYESAEVNKFDSNGIKLSSQNITKPFEKLDILEDEGQLYIKTDIEKVKME